MKPAVPRRHPTSALVLAGSLALAGCAALAPPPPRTAPPPDAPPVSFKEDGPWKKASPGAPAAEVGDAWWQLYADPVLDDLERRLVIGNQNLQAAVARVAAARVALQGSEAARQPTLSVGASASRAGSPATGGGRRSTVDSDSIGASAGWELDLWGRLSKAVEASNANLQASQDDLAAARLSAQATLVQTYLAMRTAEAQQGLLERTVAADQRLLQLTQARYASGVVSRSDVLQAETQLHSVQAQVEETRLQRAQFEHAIAVLLGEPPSALDLRTSGTLPAVPAVPELLPSTLLERRPDIAAAERRVAAAWAQIGVADAAFFPQLSLSAAAGLRGAGLASLLSAPNRFWSLGPSLAAALFDGGARRQASEQARAAADQAVANYRQTVLGAFQEVEDNLVAVDRLGAELALQRQALEAARRNLEITQDQYRAGTVSYLTVVTAQSAALSAEAGELALRNRELAAAGTLLKNIGGRWQGS